MIASDGTRQAARTRQTISNVKPYEDDEGRTRYHAHTMDKIIGDIRGVTDGWPKRVSNMLFAVNPQPGEMPSPDDIRFIGSHNNLFAWIQSRCYLRWRDGMCDSRDSLGGISAIAKSELFEELRAATRPNHDSVEYLPHVPALTGSYYLPCVLPDSDGSALAEFIANLNPETEHDAMLMQAALMTPCWGGPPGARPAFVFTSDHGVGSGKTATAEAIANVWGGAIAAPKRFDEEPFIRRLLSPYALRKRIVLMDNVKGMSASDGIESLITTGEISGHRMFEGDAGRVNVLTWFVTANVPTLSRDLADRSVMIKVGPRKHDSSFVDWAVQWLQTNRPRLIADIVSLMKSPPRCEIQPSVRTRFQAWQDAVLARFDRGNEMAAMALERIAEVDSDAEIAADIEEAIRLRMENSRVTADLNRVTISKNLMRRIVTETNLTPRPGMTQKAFGTWFKGLVKSSSLKDRLYEHRGSKGRFWLWVGPDSDPGETARVSLDDRSDDT